MPNKLGMVYLVGAGPGDPGLLTLRGAECLRRADLVLYDGLANPVLLRHTRADAERTCRSSLPAERDLGQEEINARLIAAAREGKIVVRLKGGDPFIFGRGSEEAAALKAAGVPYEVVPGITAATAAAEYAGISLTHRRLASQVTFVTGHEDPAKQESSIDYDLLSRQPGTLVFYMALHRLSAIVDALLRSGKDPATPACVVSRASTPRQRTVFAPLAELVSRVRAAELRAPSLFLVGECVRMREELAWFEKRPLFGKRIGITRPAHQADTILPRLWELGAEAILLPMIEIQPVESFEEIDQTLSELHEYHWLVFTSVNGVSALLNRLWDLGGDMRKLANCKLAAIGKGTASALEQFHLRADVVPDIYRAEALAEALIPHVRHQRVLWARASRGRDILPTQLQSAGADVRELVVYRNLDVENVNAADMELIERGEIDWICLSSPSIARSFASHLTEAARARMGNPVRLAAISPVTSEAAKKAGLACHAEATEHTWDGIFNAIIAAENAHPA